MENKKIKKFVRKILSVACCIFVMTSSIETFAYQVQYGGGDSEFNLSGKTTDGVAGQIITVKIESDGSVIWNRQTETNRFGKYEFVFNILEGVNGDITISINEGDGIVPIPLYKSTSAEVERAIYTLNSSGVCTALSSTDSVTGEPLHKILQLKMEDFTENGLITQYFNGKTFSNIYDVQNVYSKAKFLKELENPDADGSVLYTLMEDCEMHEILSGNASAVFEGYGKENKINILNKVKGTQITSDSDFKIAFTDAIIISEISKVSTDNEKWKILSDNNDYLTLNLSKYESSSVFETLKKELFKNSITSVSAMKTDVENIYIRLNNAGPQGDGGNGGNGGNKSQVSVSSGLVSSNVATPTFGFSDISDYGWAEDAIISLAADGIINGKGNGKFAPGDNVTRAEFAKIIIGAFNLLKDDASIMFNDVPETHWSYRYIASAAQKNIVNGISDIAFNPDGKITRQDMATICYRALNNLGVNTGINNSKTFVDEADISDYAKDAVRTLSGLGIINGKGNGMFAPKDFATRAEAAKIIHLLRKLR